MSRSRRIIGGFFIGFALIDALLLATWLVIGPVYASAFRATSNIAFGSLGNRAVVDFHTASASDSDTSEVSLTNTATHARVHQSINIRFLGYVPTAMVMSLVLATPISFRRRCRAVIWGLALVHLYIAARLWLTLLADFSGNSVVATFSLGEFGDGALAFLSGLLSTSIIGSYLGPIVIWIMVTFRRGDLELIMADKSETEPAAPTRSRKERPLRDRP